jgi:hypothetical protein
MVSRSSFIMGGIIIGGREVAPFSVSNEASFSACCSISFGVDDFVGVEGTVIAGIDTAGIETDADLTDISSSRFAFAMA